MVPFDFEIPFELCSLVYRPEARAPLIEFLAPDAINGRLPAYTVGLDGRLIGFEPLGCADDAEAIEKAEFLVGDRSIELWNGPRFVIRLEPE